MQLALLHHGEGGGKCGDTIHMNRCLLRVFSDSQDPGTAAIVCYAFKMQPMPRAFNRGNVRPSKSFTITMMSDQYVWLSWSCAFLLPWVAVFISFPQHRRVMLWASLFTMPFGLTEPLFVPEYWSPPSLFDLARTTGFDVESLIFCFGIGGISAVLYNLLTGSSLTPVAEEERERPLHRHHAKALVAPFVAFPALYFFPWNPIYPAIVAMVIGAVATVLCRPDLVRTTWIGGLLFLGYYLAFLVGLEWSAPGYIERVWELDRLSGVMIHRMPLEEFLFALTFGMYWSGVYAHFTWRAPVRVEE